MVLTGRIGTAGRPSLAGAAVVLLLLLAPVPARADDVRAGLEALRSEDLRVASVGYRLTTGATTLCPKRRAGATGLLVADPEQYRGDVRAVAADLFHLDRGPAVTGVVPGSAAELAGIRPGDRLIALDGRDLAAIDTDRPGGRADGSGYAALVDALDGAFAGGPATLTLERDGRRLDIRLTPAVACATEFQLTLENSLNAGADGRTVSIARKMEQLAASDDELAFVLGHEMSHNILGHRDQLNGHEPLLGAFGIGNGHILDTEMQADYYGVYAMALAGYDPMASVSFWERMRHSQGLLWMSNGTHLAGRRRTAFLQRAADEIAARRAAGRPLVPDYQAFIAGGV